MKVINIVIFNTLMLYWYIDYKCAESMKCYHKEDGGEYCA